MMTLLPAGNFLFKVVPLIFKYNYTSKKSKLLHACSKKQRAVFADSLMAF